MTRLPERTWRAMMRSMPIPCVDLIIERSGEILVGFRAIAPYKNVWALPGGRILKDERPEDAARRNLKEIHISADIRERISVFPVRFPNHPQKRHDITLCYRSEWKSGEPKPTEELTRFKWISPAHIPARVGANYRRMILKAFPL